MSKVVATIRQLFIKILYKLGIKQSRLHRPTMQLHTAFHGSEYGGWAIFPDQLSKESIVYSFGIGDDASFDRSIIERYGLSLYAFDPTPRSIQWVESQTWPAQFSFQPYGIAAQDGTAQFYPPAESNHVSYSILTREGNEDARITVQMRRLATLANMLGHSHIDILKMDVEGAEYEVIPDILQTITQSPGLTIDQILVEFHHFFPEVAPATTRKAVQQVLAAGYELFHVAPNGNEYSFIRRTPEKH